MARFYQALEAKHRDFIGAQKLFFTASTACESRINLSPKGMDSFRVVGDNCVAYLDLTGSGNETAAHLKHDGRLTLMFCSFDADPLILRLYGRGRVIRRQDAGWAEWRAHFPELPGERQIIVLDVDSVQTSCGYAVPQYIYIAESVKCLRAGQRKRAQWACSTTGAKKIRPVSMGFPQDYWRTYEKTLYPAHACARRLR